MNGKKKNNIFRQTNDFTNEVTTKELISRKFFDCDHVAFYSTFPFCE